MSVNRCRKSSKVHPCLLMQAVLLRMGLRDFVRGKCSACIILASGFVGRFLSVFVLHLFLIYLFPGFVQSFHAPFSVRATSFQCVRFFWYSHSHCITHAQGGYAGTGHVSCRRVRCTSIHLHWKGIRDICPSFRRLYLLFFASSFFLHRWSAWS